MMGTPEVIPASRRDRPPLTERPVFRFIDLFAGIGGIRAGLELGGGRCEYTVEKDRHAVRTYEANWGQVDALDIQDVRSLDLPEHEILAAGFPCQPFSLAGVSRKQHLKHEHGFKDVTSGNLFFDIVRLIGGPWQHEVSDAETVQMDPDEEARNFQADGPLWDLAPPVLLLENVKHLVSHDQRRTFRVIRRRLMQSGYWVSHDIINGAIWVPQNRRRTVIVGFRKDMFTEPFRFPSPGDPQAGPKLDERTLDPDGPELERYRLTPGVWNALRNHRARHERKGTGFGYGIAERGAVTRTLSARYYKDGAEILIPMPDGGRPRRLTPPECGRLMGFTTEHLGFEFTLPKSDMQAYRQFGNSVVVPQFNWVAEQIVEQAGHTFARRMRAEAPKRPRDANVA